MVITHPTNETSLYVGLEFDKVSDIKACSSVVEVIEKLSIQEFVVDDTARRQVLISF